MTALPANINIAHARLPETYERAKTALAECTRIDECMDWANKAEALASYAKQADDDTLRKHADRIQARAVRRCGELLKTFQTGASGGRPKNEVGDDPVSQKDAGSRVGMSERQIKTAVRVANVPADRFERDVESDAPPTVTKLAEMGKRTFGPHTPAPGGFKQATRALGNIRSFAEFCAENDPEIVANGVLPHEAKAVRAQVASIDGWMDRFVINLKG